MALPRSHPNVLAGPYLQRAALWRKDEERLRAALADPATLFVPVWHARSAIVTSADGRASAYFATGVQALAGLDTSGYILLGEFHERVVFAVAVAGENPPPLASGTELHDLRLIAGRSRKRRCSRTRERWSTGVSTTVTAGAAACRWSRSRAVTLCNAPIQPARISNSRDSIRP
jgi:hypothetical protein